MDAGSQAPRVINAGGRDVFFFWWDGAEGFFRDVLLAKVSRMCRLISTWF